MRFQSIFFAVCLLTVVSNAQEKRGKLLVTAEQLSRFPSDECQVKIFHWDIDRYGRPFAKLRELTTAVDEKKREFDLAPGYYQLFVTCPMTQPLAREVKIKANRETRVKFKLQDSKAVTYIE